MAEIRIFSSLRFKFAVLLALFSTSMMLGAMVLLEKDIRSSLIDENIRKGVGIARGVAFNVEDPLLTGDDIYLFSAVKTAIKSAGIRYALILDEKGVVKAADNIDRVGEHFLLPPGSRPEFIADDDYRVFRIPGKGADVLDLSVPIVTLADRDIKLGEIHLGLSEEIIIQAINAMRTRMGFFIAIVLLLGGFSAYFLAAISVRPVDALVAGARAIGEGYFDQRIELRRRDEFGLLTDAFNEMATSLREKEFIKNTFERYVSKPLAEQILQHKDELKLGGEEKEVTVLFSDIRGFTSLAEDLSPPEVVEFLNRYFSDVVRVVGEYDGMVDKFMGDAVMVLFGAPLSIGSEPERAVSCALEIQLIVEEINRELTQQGKAPLSVGIGINSGPVVAGNIGSQNRMEYTVIGDNVNLASRLEGLNKAYGTKVIVSESTRRAVGDNFTFRELDFVRVKGKKRPVPIFELIEGQGALQACYEEALMLYRRKEFSAARERFESAALTYNDQASRVLARRCDIFLEKPPAEDWQGDFVSQIK